VNNTPELNKARNVWAATWYLIGTFLGLALDIAISKVFGAGEFYFVWPEMLQGIVLVVIFASLPGLLGILAANYWLGKIEMRRVNAAAAFATIGAAFIVAQFQFGLVIKAFLVGVGPLYKWIIFLVTDFLFPFALSAVVLWFAKTNCKATGAPR